MRAPPLGAAAGVLADRLLGEPPARVHPVAAFGTVMAAVERRLYRDDRRAGAAHALAGISLAVLPAAALARTVASTHAIGGRRRGRASASTPDGSTGRTAATAAGTWVAVAGRELGRTAQALAADLEAADLVGARARLPALVGRDPAGLGVGEIARAVVESVAENTVDAVVAPALWAAAAGAAGALGYRAVNTMDSMVGHTSPRYLRYGWASARLDDAANWVPARVTAALVALVRPRAARGILDAVTRDAPAHPSPNAGVAEAAFAAALGLRLGGRNRYGDRVEDRAPLGSGRPPEPADIHAAVALSRDVSLALAAILLLAGLT